MPRRRGFALLLLTSSFLVFACGDDPPDKEMQQAQAAIEAARAAGAGDYAHDELAAAEQALKNAHDAVGERDYRLALTSAFDSRARAREAETQAASQKIVARGEAERLLADVSAALVHTQAHLDAARTTRPAGVLAGPQRAVGDVDRAVQEARAAFARGEYVAAMKVLMDEIARLAEVEHALDAPAVVTSRHPR
jgi:hypothetical protein